MGPRSGRQASSAKCHKQTSAMRVPIAKDLHREFSVACHRLCNELRLVVAFERTRWTAEPHLLWAEQCLQQSEEKRHPEDHYEDSDEPTERPFEGDVTKACSC